jgi:hypothetical protein
MMAVVQDYVLDQFVVSWLDTAGETHVERLPIGSYNQYIRTLAHVYLVARQSQRDALNDLIVSIRGYGGTHDLILATDSEAQIMAKRATARGMVESAATWIRPALLRKTRDDNQHHSNLEARYNAIETLKTYRAAEADAMTEYENAQRKLAGSLYQTTWREMFDIDGDDYAVRQSVLGGQDIIDNYVSGQELPL